MSQLATPQDLTWSYVTNTLTWSAVENATHYRVENNEVEEGRPVATSIEIIGVVGGDVLGVIAMDETKAYDESDPATLEAPDKPTRRRIIITMAEQF